MVGSPFPGYRIYSVPVTSADGIIAAEDLSIVGVGYAPIALTPDSRWAIFYERGRYLRVALDQRAEPVALIEGLSPAGGAAHRQNIAISADSATLFEHTCIGVTDGPLHCVAAETRAPIEVSRSAFLPTRQASVLRTG